MTVFEVTGEANYAPQVVRVAELTTLEGLDNLVGLQWAGFSADLLPVGVGGSGRQLV